MNSFIKALWGIHDHQERRLYKRRTKIDNDIKATKLNKYAPKYRVYVFGEDNYKFMLDEGFDSVLLDKRPIVWDMDKQQFRHKLEVMKVAFNDFDKYVFTDWDMMWTKPIPKDFWDVLATKESFQAIMGRYKRTKLFDRPNNRHDIPSGSFVYMSDPKVADEFIDIWKELGEIWSEEVVFSKYCERQMNGNFTLSEYWERFEPKYFKLRDDIYTPEQNSKKDLIVTHYNMRNITWILNHLSDFPFMRTN